MAAKKGDDRNINLLLFQNLEAVLDQPGMRLNIELFKEYLEYTHENEMPDLTYEEYVKLDTTQTVGKRMVKQLLKPENIEKGLKIAENVFAIANKGKTAVRRR